MNTKIFGEAILATVIAGCPVLKSTIKHTDDHFDILQEVECELFNSRIGINVYNIVKIPSLYHNTAVHFVSLENSSK